MLLYDDYRNITRHFPSNRERPSDDDNSLTTVMQCHLFDTNPLSTCCLVISSAIIGNCNDGSWHLEIVMYCSGEPTVI